MNYFNFPIAPENYHLERAFLSTFDLDENILPSLIKGDDVDKYLFVRGDGEYIPAKDENSPIKNRIVEVFYEPTNKRLSNGKLQPVKYHHAKIWLFVYKNEDGGKISKLIIQSKNIYPYDSLEVEFSFVGQKVLEKQSKNDPLVLYFQSLLPFADEEKKSFIASLIEEIPYFSYRMDGKDFEIDDFEFVMPICQDILLFEEEYDEILVVAPFINVESINALLAKKKEGARCVVVSQPKIIESLIIGDVQGAQYLSPNVYEKFIHAKIYLVRRRDSWDLYAGSMNLSDYSITRNIEAMVHLKNVKGITDIESFLHRLIGKDISSEIEQYSTRSEIKGVSPVFVDAAKIATRIRYIKKLLSNKKHDEESMNRVSSYLLSSKCVKDLLGLANFEKEAIPLRHQVVTGGKNRFVYNLSFEDNTIFGLINYSLHQYDRLFSKNVFLHIMDRSINGAFVKIHETEGVKDFYLFKTDIQGFDPSMDKGVLCAQLDKLIGFDAHFCRFAKSIVNGNRYRVEGDDNIYTDDVIHQTGLPLGGFFENVYLHDVDFSLEKAPLYLRCGDDILIGAKSKEEIETLSNSAIAMIEEKKLSPSKHKTFIAAPGEKVAYLGCCIHNGEVDFTENALKDIQKTIKRKTKDLLIMYGKKRVPNALRLPSVVKYVKHYQKSEFFIGSFERITVTDGLKAIDKMIMDLIRTAVSGKTGNSKYKIKYSTIQAFGYKSLVNQYYDYISNKK